MVRRVPSPPLRLTLQRRADDYRANPQASVFGYVAEAIQLGAFPVLSDLWALVLLRPDGALYVIDDEAASPQATELADGPERWWTLSAVARRESLPELRDLLPPRPPTSLTCSMCGGTGEITLAPGRAESLITGCNVCHTLGWVESVAPPAP